MSMVTRCLGFGVLAWFLLAVAACGGGSSGSSGSLSLAVTDAPVDEASEVVVRFTRAELQPSGGERISIEFDEVQEIDLLSFQGEDVHWLFEDTQVPAGEYDWIRLYVERDGTVASPPSSIFGTTSYVTIGGSEYKLAIPSGLQTGLKLVGGFTVAEEGDTRLVLDFDLRRALVKPAAGVWDSYYFLRPALRLVNLSEIGHLHGTIDTQVFIDDPACEDNGAVYLYEGHDQVPTDVQGDAGPLTTALIKYDAVTDAYHYRIGHLPPGGYTLALTCEAHLDDPDTAEAINFFTPATNVTIVAGALTEQDLP
jgi:hypothetical protein